MNEMMKFDFNGLSIRTVCDEKGEILFVGKDIAEALGYTNPSKALNDHCKSLKLLNYNDLLVLGFTNPPPSGLNAITEPDVLRLIVSSKLESAQKFERWVFEEVLPTIRKTGSYTAQAPKGSLSLLSVEMKAAIDLATLCGLSGNPALLSADIAVRTLHGLSPLKLLGQTHLINPDQELYFTPTELGAKRLLSAIEVNKLLQINGFQKKDAGKWRMTEKGKEFGVYLDTGKKHSDGTMVQQLKWKGAVMKACIEV